MVGDPLGGEGKPSGVRRPAPIQPAPAVMNIHAIVRTLLIALVAAVAGYALRSARLDSVGYSAAGQVPVFDYFLKVRSFSEVESARAVLEALASRELYALQLERAAILQQLRTANGQPPSADGSGRFAGVIGRLESAIEEFRGTDQEPAMIQELLWVLYQERWHARWLDLYLDTLYRYPTREIVGDFALKAAAVGHAVGRFAEVSAAFRHVMGIPFDFEAKNWVREAMEGDPLARLDPGTGTVTLASNLSPAP